QRKTTVAQVRRWAAEEAHPNGFWAAYAALAQRLTRVEDRLDAMGDSLRMMLGQLAALECQDRESEEVHLAPPCTTRCSWRLATLASARTLPAWWRLPIPVCRART